MRRSASSRCSYVIYNWIYFPFHCRRTYRDHSFERCPWYCLPRYVLRCCSLPLCPFFRSCFLYFCWILLLNAGLHRSKSSRGAFKDSFLSYILRSKLNILPNAFLRIGRNASSNSRLSRCLCRMKQCSIIWFNGYKCRNSLFFLRCLLYRICKCTWATNSC